MQFGQPFGVSPGNNEELIEYMRVYDIGDGPKVIFSPLSGYDQYFRLQVDGEWQGIPKYAISGQDNQLNGVWQSNDNHHVISLVPQGMYSNPIDYPYQQADFQSGRGENIRVNVDTSPSFVSYNDSGQLSSWALTGIKRFINCRPVEFRRSWGELDLSLTGGPGIRTVELSIDGVILASGSRANDGVVTLTEQNGSGINGSVSVVFSGATANAKLVIRFPASIKVHYKTSAFTAPDFPRTAEGTIIDDGYANSFAFKSIKLAAGTYYVVAHQRDENDNEGTGLHGGGDAITLVATPLPPSGLAYSSGDFSNTIVEFTASLTAGATYNIYDSAEDGIININTPSYTHIAGTGTLTQALSAIGAGFTGIRYVLVRAVKDGIEEGNLEYIAIEYSSGVRIPSRPNPPFPGRNITTSGRSISIPFIVDTTDQQATPVSVKLFVYAPGGAPDYNNPNASVNLGTPVGSTISEDSDGNPLEITYTHPSDAVLMFTLRTVSDESAQSDNVDTYGPVYLTTELPNEPTQDVRIGN